MTSKAAENTTPSLSEETVKLFDSWLAVDGPVALRLRQMLLPVEADESGRGVIFPPTYADIGYNIDTLADGTRVATIDTVGSQANRLEPIFKSTGKDADGRELNALASLVPQVEIVLHGAGDTNGNNKQEGDDGHIEKRSLLDLAHRSADAVVLASPTLAPEIAKAFEALRNKGNAAPLAAIAPTSRSRAFASAGSAFFARASRSDVRSDESEPSGPGVGCARFSRRAATRSRRRASHGSFGASSSAFWYVAAAARSSPSTSSSISPACASQRARASGAPSRESSISAWRSARGSPFDCTSWTIASATEPSSVRARRKDAIAASIDPSLSRWTSARHTSRRTRARVSFSYSMRAPSSRSSSAQRPARSWRRIAIARARS